MTCLEGLKVLHATIRKAKNIKLYTEKYPTDYYYDFTLGQRDIKVNRLLLQYT